MESMCGAPDLGAYCVQECGNTCTLRGHTVFLWAEKLYSVYVYLFGHGYGYKVILKTLFVDVCKYFLHTPYIHGMARHMTGNSPAWTAVADEAISV